MVNLSPECGLEEGQVSHPHLFTSNGYAEEVAERSKLYRRGFNVQCDICGTWHASKGALSAHKSTQHRDHSKKQNMQCPLCEEEVQSHRALAEHAEAAHARFPSQYQVECLTFENREGYESWRKEMDGRNVVKWTKTSVDKRGDKSTAYYRCSRALATPRDAETLRPKSKKNTKYCTAFMQVAEQNGTFRVTYCSGHAGHDENPQSLTFEKDTETLIFSLLEERCDTKQFVEKIGTNSQNSDNHRVLNDSAPQETSMVVSRDNKGAEEMSSSTSTTSASETTKDVVEMYRSMRRSLMVLACPQCSKVLSNGSNLRRHLAEVHGHMSRVEKWEAQKVEEEWEREMCPVCQMFLQSPKEIYYHAKRNHNFEGVVQKETFANYDEFEKWKETMERLHASCWNRKHQTVTSNVCYRYFRCHRSTNQRRISRKRRASMRPIIHRSCTSFMNVKSDVRTGITTVEFCVEHFGHEVESQNSSLDSRSGSIDLQDCSQKSQDCSHPLIEEDAVSNSLEVRNSSLERVKASAEERDGELRQLYWTASQDVGHFIRKKLNAINEGCSKLQAQGSKETYHSLRKIDEILSKALSFMAGAKEQNDLHELHPTGIVAEQQLSLLISSNSTKIAITPRINGVTALRATSSRIPCQLALPVANGHINDGHAAVCGICGQKEPIVYDSGVRRPMVDWMLCDECGAWVHMSCARTRECSNCGEGYLELDYCR